MYVYKGDSLLHVLCKQGQVVQVEALLKTYGPKELDGFEQHFHINMVNKVIPSNRSSVDYI